jgi:putative Mg2+ transporter-C (MgtC) family protein
MLSEIEIITRLAVAAAAGAAIGWERESHRKPAGLRTHMLVSLGAAAFVQAAVQVNLELQAAGHSTNGDLIRVISGIVGGVGFLGAGSIIRAGGNVRGLTTAATIWLSSAIGVACGFGYYLLAANSVLLALAILVVLGLLERLVFSQPAPASNTDAPAAPKDQATHVSEEQN